MRRRSSPARSCKDCTHPVGVQGISRCRWFVEIAVVLLAKHIIPRLRVTEI